jgi:GT2 family glycosyltransferase
MSVSLIIPVHNHWRVTAKCLVSIYKSDLPEQTQVIVVDDASTDQTQALLGSVIKSGKEVKVITNVQNAGYVKSMNKGIQASSGDYIVFMNNDTLLAKNCIAMLVKTFEKHTELGILGALQCDAFWKQKDPLIFLLRGKNAIQRDHVVTSNIPQELENSDVVYCDSVHSPCALTSRNVIEQIGMFDEMYGWGNYEQEDFCMTIKEKLHKQVAVCPQAKFVHFGSVSVSDDIVFWSHELDVNREKFLKKWGEKLFQNLV